MSGLPAPGRVHLCLAGLLLAPACAFLPEDHGLRRALGSFDRSMRSIGGSFQSAVDHTTTDLAVFTREVSALPQKVGESTAGMARSISAVAAGSPAAFADGIRGVGRSTQVVVGRASDDLRRLPSPAMAGAQLESGMRNLRHGLSRTPEVLRLDRRPMAEPTDPEHETSLRPAPRPASWLERILRRMGLAK